MNFAGMESRIKANIDSCIDHAEKSPDPLAKDACGERIKATLEVVAAHEDEWGELTTSLSRALDGLDENADTDKIFEIGKKVSSCLSSTTSE